MYLNPADLRIDTYSNGIRGDSCIRITHLPTGMVSSCDSDCLVHLGTYGISNERKACAIRTAIRTIELIVDRELNKHYKDPSMSLLKRDENLTREEIESEKKISEAKKIEN